MNNRLKLFLILLLLFLALELGLHLMAQTLVRHKNFENFDRFLSRVPEIISSFAGEEVLYFVGDSTVFGVGSSDPFQFSLPVQLEGLLNISGSHLKCVNLAYPGTCTEEHLQVLSLIPAGSQVFYRGGASDKWNFGSRGFRFSFAGHAIEFRSLKMLSILVFRFFPSFRWWGRGENVRAKLKEILIEKQLQITCFEYSAPNGLFFYLSPEALPRVPVFQMMNTGGFLTAEGYIDIPYRGLDGGHPNDLGYFLEAQCIFNYLCEQGLFGLRLEQMQKLSTTGFMGMLKEKYETMLAQLRSFGTDDVFYRQVGQLRNLVCELWAIADILYHNEPQNERFRLESKRLERLALLVFYDIRVGQSLLRLKPTREELELYAAVMKATVDPESELWVHIRAVIDNCGFSLMKKNISHLLGVGSYPLELCQRFQRESGYTATELSTRADWEYFIPLPYDSFAQFVLPVCD